MILRPAYTLAEALIVATLIGVLSLGFTISVQDFLERSALKNNQAAVVNIIQEARNRVLTNTLVSGESLDYYVLELTAEGMELRSNDGTVLSQLSLTKGVAATWEADACSDRWRIWYFVKDSTLTFDDPENPCSTEARSREFTLHSPQDKYQAAYSVDVYGGFPQELTEEQSQ